MKVNNKKIIDKVLSLCAAVTITVFSGVSHADDIEIYEAISNAEVLVGDRDFNPNVLFVLDNSGSMSRFRVIADGGTPSITYDPTKTYPLNAGGESANNRNDAFYIYDDRSFSGDGIRLGDGRNHCQASKDFLNDPANAADPVYEDELAQWTFFRRRSEWRWWSNITRTQDGRRKIECKADNGVHGFNTGVRFLNTCFNGCSLQQRYVRAQQTLFGRLYPWDVNSRRYGRFRGRTERVIVSGNYHEYIQNRVDVTEIAKSCTNNDQIVNNTATNGQNFRCLQKLEIMKRALINVVAADPGDPDATPPVPATSGISGINLGLMRFNENADGNNATNQGGTLIDAVADVDTPLEDEAGNEITDGTGRVLTNRDDFVKKVEGMKFERFTPLAESMYEAYRYFNGDTPDTSETTTSVTGQSTLDTSALSGGRFDSPIGTNQCQDNFTVLLSDGSPREDVSRNAQIAGRNAVYDDGELVLAAVDGLPNATLNGVVGCGDDNNCLNEVTRALQKNRGVTTFTIGFDIDIPILENAANSGSPEGSVDGSGYFTATDLSSLEEAFRAIISEIQRVESDNFVAPAVTVNAFNRLQNRSDIYYAVFKPELLPRWDGNIKKYKIANGAQIVDINNANAIDATTGFFIDNETRRAQSYWSNTPDGAVVDSGGFAGERTIERNLFANIDANVTDKTITTLAKVGDAASIAKFTSIIVNEDATGVLIGVDQALTGTLSATTGGTSDRERNLENIIRFTLGQEVEDDLPVPTTANNYVAESIHSTPVVLSFGTTDATPRDVVFVTTNQGMLHAVRGQGSDEPDGVQGSTDIGGEELWSYIPDRDLLENLGGYYNQELNNNADHIYGLDGEIASLVERNSSNVVTKANLFMGQRRGGNKYFAINVTNALNSDNPVSKLWTIEGGSTQFPRMADTWARPVITNFRSCPATASSPEDCTIVPALVLGGGYDGRDGRYDDPAANIADLGDDQTNDTLGNAIYIVNAETGAVLWSASRTAADVSTARGDVVNADMKHSFPTAPTVLDVNQDGAIDIMFAVDISGQVFRFDFRQISNAAGTSTEEVRTGGRIADLRITGENRRFFNPVDGVLLPETVDENDVVTAFARITLVTGSGYRAHPLAIENFQNYLYTINDENIFGPALDNSGNPVYSYAEISTNNFGPILTTNLPVLPVPSEVQPAPVTDPDADPDATPTVTTPILQSATTHRNGFRVPLQDNDSEKIINPTLISDFQVIAVSYDPSVVNSRACSAAPGLSRAYQLNLLTGETTFFELTKGGVSAAPVLVYILDPTGGPDGGEALKPIVIIGTEPFEGETFDLGNLNIGKAEKKAWWEFGRGNSN